MCVFVLGVQCYPINQCHHGGQPTAVPMENLYSTPRWTEDHNCLRLQKFLPRADQGAQRFAGKNACILTLNAMVITEYADL